jgi:hypothetical protein
MTKRLLNNSTGGTLQSALELEALSSPQRHDTPAG